MSVIRPVVTYGAETMYSTGKEEEKLEEFERKVVRLIYSLRRVEKY